MSQWAQVQQLPLLRHVQEMYGVHFPMEVRHFLAHWIESQPWEEVLRPDTPKRETYAQTLYEQLLQELGNKVQEVTFDNNMFVIRVKLEEAVTHFKDQYENNCMNLVSVVCNLLRQERDLLQQMEEATMGDEEARPVDRSPNTNQINQELENLIRRTQMTDNEQRLLNQKQESFIVQYQDFHKLQAQLQQLQSTTAADRSQKELVLKNQINEMTEQLRLVVNSLLEARQKLAQQFSDTVDGLREVQRRVLDEEMISWKKRQALAGNGASFDNNIDQLQKWCETLSDLIWQNRQQIKKALILSQRLPIELPGGQQDRLSPLNDAVTSLLSSLVTSTFLVETQPPQVLKKDACFSTTVRLLVGGKLNVFMNPPTVEAAIINEKQARDLLRSEVHMRHGTCGEILNNSGPMEFNQATSTLSITFKNMKLKQIKRSEKKGATENVTGEKFCILFQSKFNVGGNELFFQVWTLSVPIVVIVHGNQECAATATILWDNAFAESGREPFVVPETVPWPLMATQLDCKFKSYTGRGLSQEHLQYIASKLLGGEANSDYSNSTITRSTFNKDNLHGRSFKFWEWFYSIMKLTKEHLKGPWVDGSIMGFVSKIEAQELLMSKPNGTFLLRFSDSEVGGVTIAWIMEDSVKLGQREVWNLVPFTDHDFKKLSLADRIRDLGQIIYLYPSINKSQAFGKYYTPSVPTTISNGYIAAVITSRVVMPDQERAQMSMDNPQTPLSSGLQPQSPTSPTGYEQSPLVHPVDGSPFMGIDEAMQDLEMEDPCALDYNTEDIVSILYQLQQQQQNPQP